MSKVETVKVELQLPKGIIDFLQGMRKNVEEYLTQSILRGFKADLDNRDVFFNPEEVLSKFNLRN